MLFSRNRSLRLRDSSSRKSPGGHKQSDVLLWLRAVFANDADFFLSISSPGFQLFVSRACASTRTNRNVAQLTTWG